MIILALHTVPQNITPRQMEHVANNWADTRDEIPKWAYHAPTLTLYVHTDAPHSESTEVRAELQRSWQRFVDAAADALPPR